MGQPVARDKKIDVESFIAFWGNRNGGSERADAQEFLKQLCALIGAEAPHDAQAAGARTQDYAFGRKVLFRHEDSTTSPGFIDLYKRDCFVLEAKQSKKRSGGEQTYDQLSLAFDAVLVRERKGAAPGQAWDVLMRSARRQAQGYARMLDEWPPFIVIVDVGNVIELWSDFQRQGKDYVQFPNRNEFRIRMEDLRQERVRERLRKVWTDPLSLDPSRHSAEVTQEIARYLALITQSMERRAKLETQAQKDHWASIVAKILMRCIFAMFADSIGLLPKGGFAALISRNKGKAATFHHVLDHFFREMDKGAQYSPLIEAKVREFNGGLFHDSVSLPMNEDELALLEKAALRDWAHVEPAIFGTLLEQALSTKDRSKLGAHHTPRAYVERLVVPTIMEPLNEDWDIVQSQSIGKVLASDYPGAREAVKRFHDRLCHTRVLDPACGTGNFLYVAMELMKRLEGEVFDFLRELGEPNEPLQVDPHQFLGIEKNPRAAPIAELVLWIGYIQWWFRTRDRSVLQEPILRKFDNIKVGDAVLASDREELLTDASGRPITRQDPAARKLHPITGEEIPDPDARLEVWRYVHPRVAKWPEAEFIVGNPPFIGGKDLRAELGDGYAEALWKSRGKKTDSIDFVMYWWDMAAQALLAKGSKLRRFGFITTNSITQTFSRRMIEKHLGAKAPLALVFAVPDHPWLKQSGKAAVRIAMTVADPRRA